MEPVVSLEKYGKIMIHLWVTFFSGLIFDIQKKTKELYVEHCRTKDLPKTV